MNMSQYFHESGEIFPVTVLKIPKMTVVQVKTLEGKDKYNAVQVGIGNKKKISKSEAGHVKDLKNFSQLSEFRVKDASSYARGQNIDLAGFQLGELVNVVGISKGRGFAGVMKRHGFAGFPKSHGHDKPRSVGSIGQRWPQHTRKGLRMSGHMGVKSVSVKNLQVVEVDVKKGLMAVKGAVPGHRNAIVKIESSGKIKPLVRAEKIDAKKK